MSPARPPEGANSLSEGLSPDTDRPCGRAVPGEGLTPLWVRRREAPRVPQ
jgi:hypothetical protein